jgi:hypothetical protein
MKLRLGPVSAYSPNATGRFLVGKFGAMSIAHDGNARFVRAAAIEASPGRAQVRSRLGRAGQLAKREGGYLLMA